MSWSIIVPIVVIILLALNSIYVVFWLRPKHGIKTEMPNRKTCRRKAKPVELFASILVVICGLALIVVPEVAPRSQFVKWIAEHGILVYVVWCFVGIVTFSVIFELIRNKGRFPLAGKRTAKNKNPKTEETKD